MKLIIIFIVAVFIASSLNAGEFFYNENKVSSIELNFEFDKPLIKNGKVFLGGTSNQKIFVPSIPSISKTFLFPLGTKIKNISYKIGKIFESSAILSAYNPFLHKNYLYKGNYPSKWLEYNIGRGIDNGSRVIILSLHINPIKYDGKENKIKYLDSVKIEIDYEKHEQEELPSNYDLLIIAPSQFKDALQPLINEKESHGIKTILMTVEDITSKYNGRDNAEKVKYAIKDAIEQYGIKYVLLVGSESLLPIRKTHFSWKWEHGQWNETMITDLYYADIYDANGSFSSWDTNNNGVYGEIYYGINSTSDVMDLYPDVYVGRLACKNVREVKTIVNKIIEYENEEKPWFKNILLAGGDTFPWWKGYEGEEEIEKVKSIMKNFNPIELKTSDGSFKPANINHYINTGVGFFYYSGHGFPYGIGTHPPNNDSWIYYLSPYMVGLRNDGKLPVILFDACLTSKLDFTFGDLINDTSPYIKKILYGIANLTGIKNKKIECFSWKWISKNNGGAIAVIGATRVSFMDIGTYFFKQYKENITLGEQFSNFETSFINEEGKGYYTIEEFILLGDPSLKLS